MLKEYCQPRSNIIGIHSRNVAGFLKHLEHCSYRFSYFRQSKSRETIDLVLLQKTRVTTGESMTMENLYNSSWGFVHKSGRSLWTESEHSREGVAMLLNPYSSVTEMFPWSAVHWTPHWINVQLTLLEDSVLVVKTFYAPSVKSEWASIFESIQLLLGAYDGPSLL